MWQNSKTKNETKLKKKLKCDNSKTQNLQNSKTQNESTQNVTKPKNSKCDKTQQPKLLQNSKP